jgi:hypothetical protein
VRDKGVPGYPQPATYVAARWQVPYVDNTDPGGLFDVIGMAVWCGIDGPDAGQILQGGTVGKLEAGTVFHWAWAEWYPDVACRFTNLAVRPGDWVACSVWAVEPQLGFVSIANLTRNHGSAMYVQAPDGIATQGASVEWVVEQVGDHLPSFTPVLFEGCVGGSATEAVRLVAGGQGREIVDSQGHPATRTWAVTDQDLLITWLGFSDAGDGPPTNTY